MVVMQHTFSVPDCGQLSVFQWEEVADGMEMSIRADLHNETQLSSTTTPGCAPGLTQLSSISALKLIQPSLMS